MQQGTSFHRSDLIFWRFNLSVHLLHPSATLTFKTWIRTNRGFFSQFSNSVRLLVLFLRARRRRLRLKMLVLFHRRKAAELSKFVFHGSLWLWDSRIGDLLEYRFLGSPCERKDHAPRFQRLSFQQRFSVSAIAWLTIPFGQIKFNSNRGDQKD